MKISNETMQNYANKVFQEGIKRELAKKSKLQIESIVNDLIKKEVNKLKRSTKLKKDISNLIKSKLSKTVLDTMVDSYLYKKTSKGKVPRINISHW